MLMSMWFGRLWVHGVSYTCVAWSYRRASPTPLISRLHVSVVNPLVSRGRARPPPPLCPPVTLSSPPPQMGPFISPQNTNNGHWKIPKGWFTPLTPAQGQGGIMMQVVAKGGEREALKNKTTTANTNKDFFLFFLEPNKERFNKKIKKSVVLWIEFLFRSHFYCSHRTCKRELYVI